MSMIIFGGGLDNILGEAGECFRYQTPGECNNPFWSEENDDPLLSEYREMIGMASAENDNPLMVFLIMEVNADPYEGSNFDPLWLEALLTNQEVFTSAKIKAFVYLQNEGYMEDFGNDYLLRVLGADIEGYGD